MECAEGFMDWALAHSCHINFVYETLTNKMDQNGPSYGFVERVKLNASIHWVIVKPGMTLVSICSIMLNRHQ